MRKKFIKSSRPTYKKRIKKAQQGMRFVSYNPVSNPTIDYTDITNPINPFSEYNYNTTYDKPTALVVPVRDTDETDVVANNHTVEPVINKSVASKVTYTPKSYKGLAAFNKAYDEVEASNPEAKKYRQFLTKMAEQESGFNSAIQNRAGAPAYGYFQFMQDDKKYNNIRQYAGTDIETFRNNPKLQIEAAIKLAKSFEKGFSKEDLELANKNGYSTWGLLGGAWLAGNGGVRKFLRGQGNPSDRHWNKEGKGTDVATRIKAFNFKEGGMIVKYQNPPHGVARRDAIKDYRPNIPNRIRRATPAEHIQSMIDIYGQSEQPTVTSDAKSPWQHQQAQEAASKGYDDYMQAKKYEEGLHNLNGILTFTDYATLATGLGSLLSKGASMAGRYAGKQMAKRAVGKEFKRQADAFVRPLERQRFMETATSMRGNSDVKMNMRNFVEYLLKPETQKRVANIDAELGTKYGEAISEFVKKYKAGELKVTPRTKGELDVFGDVIKKSQTSPSEAFLQSGSYDDIFFDILKRDPAHVPGHEAKHGIEMVNAALTKGIMTEEEYLKFMRSESPRLQALMKDNIVSEDEFVKRIMKEHPDYNEVSVRNRYKYLTSPTEFNSQLHPLIEFEQRAGKSGVPNFKSVDEIDRLINNNPYVGTSENNGLRNLRIMFNYIIKDKNEFMRRFNKYGFGTAVGVPTAATINNYDNEK